MLSHKARPFDPKTFLAQVGSGRTILQYPKNKVIFAQGGPCDAVFYIQEGRAKVTVLSTRGKEATIALLGAGYLVSRNNQIQEDLVDQLFNSAEKRLARTLLLLARFGKEGRTENVVPKISQETWAEMVGTTRARVNFFMNRFRQLGLIDYNGGLEVHSSLLDVVLHD